LGWSRFFSNHEKSQYRIALISDLERTLLVAICRRNASTIQRFNVPPGIGADR
jgi:hypothetical protein